MQSNISISGDVVSGTLKYVTGYTGFSGDASEQKGNYLALHFSSTNAGATITAELFGGNHPGRVVTLDPDGILITRVVSTDEAIRVIASVDGGEPTVKVFSLAGLTLTPAS